MKVLRATDYMKRKLDGYRKNNCQLSFVKDGNGEWITSKGNLNNPDFADISDNLKRLKEIDYVPFDDSKNYF